MKKNIKHFFLLTALAAGTIHFVNRFINMTADIKNILKAENGNFYDWKNGQIYYTKRGSGSPLLLIHDLDPVSSSYEWCKVIRKLEKKHTVYTLDLLGCGRSAKPYLTYTNYLYVQLVTDFIQNVIGEKTDIIASNESVSFVTLACNMNKDLANSIIAINPTSLKELHITTDKYASVKKTLLELPVIGTFLYNIKVSNTNITKYFREEYLRHVVDHYCPICNKEKPHPTIDPEKCKGCGKCRKNCPMEAISGTVKQPHTIDPEKCVNCGACVSTCPFGAITASK